MTNTSDRDCAEDWTCAEHRQEQVPPGRIIPISECVLGEVYWVVAAGTVRDGYCYLRARYEQDESADPNRFYCYAFVALPEGDSPGGERGWYARTDEVIVPEVSP